MAPATIAPPSKVDIFVTDEGADAEMLRETELAGVRVVFAGPAAIL